MQLVKIGRIELVSNLQTSTAHLYRCAVEVLEVRLETRIELLQRLPGIVSETSVVDILEQTSYLYEKTWLCVCVCGVCVCVTRMDGQTACLMLTKISEWIAIYLGGNIGG